MRLARLIGPELESFVRECPDELPNLLDEIHPEDIADVLGDFEDDQAVELLRHLPTDYAAQVFSRLDEERQGVLADRLGAGVVARIAGEMDADERADFFSILPPTVGETVLEELERVDPEAAEDVEELRRWPEASAGGLMTTDYISVGPSLTIQQAIEEVRKAARDAETVDTVYVVDGAHKVLGFLTLRDLLLSSNDDTVAEAMRHNVISVTPELDQEEVAKVLAKYDLHALPVVHENGEMLGVITSDDILDVITEEQAEDVQKMGAIAPIADRYFDVTLGMFVRKRAPWLIVLFIGGFFTTEALKRFDHVLATVAQLAFYVPLLISAGGNSGSQSSTLVIRGLAVGDISTRDWWRVLYRELGQGLVLGALLGSLGLMRVLVAGDGGRFALLIGVTILCIVTMGCVVGGMLPIVLHRVGLDPATSSNPFIATLVDVLGIVIYLTAAQWVMSDVLGRVPVGS
ncbi:MAG TPA: magnesium transporter [Polyangiaceae bacterium]|nr:magnesium transporter [Polyangiaceae bacterium]